MISSSLFSRSLYSFIILSLLLSIFSISNLNSNRFLRPRFASSIKISFSDLSFVEKLGSEGSFGLGLDEQRFAISNVLLIASGISTKIRDISSADLK